MADPDPALVSHLRRLGATEAQIAGLDDSMLIGLASDLRLADGLDLSLADLAATCGVDETLVVAVYRSLGLDVEALAGFGDADVALVSLATGGGSAVVDELAEELMRVAGGSLRRLAEATVAAYVQDVEHHPDRRRADLVELADLNSEASAVLLAFASTLGTVFRHHMWVAVRNQRLGQRNVSQPELIEAAVGFVDLVGFTPMSRALAPQELMALLDGFERRAFDAATAHGGRIVKSIGDEVMITAPDLGAVAAIAVALVDEAGDDPAHRPRGGVSAGSVVFRMGDLYGPVVNVASRLVDVAEPGQVLTDVATGAPGLSLEPAGARTLKGFDRPVDVWSVTRVGASR